MQEKIIEKQEQASANAKDLSNALSCVVSLCAFVKPESEEETPTTYKDMSGLFTLLQRASEEIEKDINTSIQLHYESL